MTANNPNETKMSADELKQRYESNLKSNTSTVRDANNIIKDTNNALTQNSDSVSDAGDTIADSASDLIKSNEALVSSIDSIGYNSSDSSRGGGRSGSSGGMSGSSLSEADRNGIKQAQKDYNTAKAKGDKAGMSAAHNRAESIRNKHGYSGGTDGSKHISIKKKATGGINLPSEVYNIDEMGTELLIEPTEGRYVKLSAGSGVIPADITKNLWDIGSDPTTFVLNALPKLNMSPMAIKQTGQSVVNQYQIGKVEFPNVNDTTSAKAFIEELLNGLPAKANQYASRR